jgi:NAD(P)-dependent dehydrogenase (short-subunit alcohol dehydrogenase family)
MHNGMNARPGSAAVAGLAVVLLTARNLWSSISMTTHSGVFMITGASTGIGRATVDRLVKDGHTVWASVRRSEDQAALKDAYGDHVQVLRFDVTDNPAVRRAGETLAARAGQLNGLVANAGTALPGPLEYFPLDLFREQLEINLTGQLAVIQAFLPALRAARSHSEPARIVAIGSIGGRVAGSMIGAYHASKFGLVGLTDTLRAELAPSGIDVVLVEPGAIATPIWQRATTAADAMLDSAPEARERYGAQIEASVEFAKKSAEEGLPPEAVASVIADALTADHPRPRRLVGRDARAAAAFVRLTPEPLRYRLMNRPA